jgi:CheY-like chemotaxis protein
MSKKQTILIVDDDSDDREILRDAFMAKHKDHREYVFIETGDHLLEYLANGDQEELPSLIMLDLNMPGKDGREALKEIKGSEHLRSIPTIIFTTSGSQKDKDVSYNLGANCFITKPDTFNKLVEMVNCINQIWLQESF